MADVDGKRFVAVVDRGFLRVFRLTDSPNGRPPHLEPVDEWRPAEAHEKTSDKVTDDAGRFPSGHARNPAIGDLTIGERHGIELEETRRLVRRLAERVGAILEREDAERSYLAVSAPIHQQFLAALDSRSRRRISRVLARDLSRTPPGEILAHFDEPA